MGILFYRRDQIINYSEDDFIDGYYTLRQIAISTTLWSFSEIFGLELYERRMNAANQTKYLFDNEDECPEMEENGDYRGNRFYRCLVDKNCLTEELRVEYVGIYKELLGLIEKVCDENLILKDEYKQLFKGYKIEESIYPFSPDRCYSKLTNLQEGEKEQNTPFDFRYTHEYVKEFVDKFEKYKGPEYQIVF